MPEFHERFQYDDKLTGNALAGHVLDHAMVPAIKRLTIATLDATSGPELAPALQSQTSATKAAAQSTQVLGHQLLQSQQPVIQVLHLDAVYAFMAASFGPRVSTRGISIGKPVPHQTDTTRFLDIEQADGLIDAFLYAEQIGAPLNTHLTITWGGTGTDAANVKRCTTAQTALLKSVGEMFARQNHPFTYTYVREAAEYGMHSHILLHIRPYRWSDIKQALTALVEKRLPQLRPRDRHAFKITPPMNRHQSDSHAECPARVTLLGYQLKGVDPAALVHINGSNQRYADLIKQHLRRDVEPQGEIVGGKRAGWSENLGIKARTVAHLQLSWIERLIELRERHEQIFGLDYVIKGSDFTRKDGSIDYPLIERSQPFITLSHQVGWKHAMAVARRQQNERELLEHQAAWMWHQVSLYEQL